MPPSTAQKRSVEAKHLQFEQAQNLLLPYLTGRGLGAVVLDRFRLGYVSPAPDVPRQYWHRMSIPYVTPSGIVQLRYKCIDQHHDKSLGIDPRGCPKVLVDAGQEVTLYNPVAVLDARGPLFLTEGEPDVWAITTLFGYPAVGVPGAQAWSKHPYWPRVFVGHQLILPADGDPAGREFAETVKRDLPETKIVQLPEGEDALSVLTRDPDEFAAFCGL